MNHSKELMKYSNNYREQEKTINIIIEALHGGVLRYQDKNPVQAAYNMIYDRLLAAGEKAESNADKYELRARRMQEDEEDPNRPKGP